MHPRTTGILLIIAVALGVFVYMELQGEGADGDAEGTGERLFALILILRIQPGAVVGQIQRES